MVNLAQNTPFYGGVQLPNPVQGLSGAVAPPTNVPSNAIVGQTTYTNTVSGAVYMLTSKSPVTWTILGGATAAIATINSQAPIAGNYVLAGTTNQITATNTAGTTTFSIPAAFTAPGSIASTTTITSGTSLASTTSITAGTTITATLGNIIATNGNFVASTAGTGLLLNPTTASGTTTATLNGRVGQVTVTTPSIAAGATFSFALTNSSVTANTTQILYGLVGGTSGAAVTIQSVTNSSGTSTIVFTNGTGATTNTASLILTFLVLN